MTGHFFMGCANRLEVFWQVILLDVGIGDIAAQRREPVVERKLIDRIVRDRKPAVVAGRKDVARSVVKNTLGEGSTGRRRRGCGDRSRQRDARCDCNDADASRTEFHPLLPDL